MQKYQVVRAYSVAVGAVMAVTSWWSFQPHELPTERPPDQQVLYRQVPMAELGPPPVASPVDHGEALAYIRIPRFGREWLWTVLEGTEMDVLDRGPGHFTGTAWPGERGNTAYAAHRSGHGDPFLDFETLEPGDEIILAQNGAEWTYTVTMTPAIIEPNEGWVVKNMTWGHWLTLTTCWPKYGSEKRMYVRAKLTDRETSD